MFFVKVYPAVTVTDATAIRAPGGDEFVPLPPPPKLTGKAWVSVSYGRRAKELLAMTITEASGGPRRHPRPRPTAPNR